jgi:hypothetical protein
MSRWLFVGIFWVAVLLLISDITSASGKRPPVTKPGGKTGMIQGTVIEIGDRGLSKGAQVVLFRGFFHDTSIVASTSPDTLGEFRFSNLNPGLYNLAITGPTMEGDGVADVRVACDSASIVTLVVEPYNPMIPDEIPKGWGGQIVPIKDLDSDKREVKFDIDRR